MASKKVFFPADFIDKFLVPNNKGPKSTAFHKDAVKTNVKKYKKIRSSLFPVIDEITKINLELKRKHRKPDKVV